MVEKIFWQDPYCSELITTVTSINGNQITLAQTIFYAFSGGQERDHGSIGGIQVNDAKKDGKEIVYMLAQNPTFAVGSQVNVIIDWERRYRLMRLHFAAELVLELIYQKYPETPKVGAHIAADKSRIDFAWHGSIAPLLPELQQQAQIIIDSEQAVISDFSDKTSEQRYWQIKSFDQVACGGTHIRNTKEIGKIKLKRKNPGKDKERIEIYLI